jgi:hypothetical protein
MDVYCPVCGEPWDHDTIHDVAGEKYGVPYGTPGYSGDEYSVHYRTVQRDFQARGCAALGGECGPASTRRDPVFGLTAQEAAGALYEILGDDMDGAMSELMDMGF